MLRSQSRRVLLAKPQRLITGGRSRRAFGTSFFSPGQVPVLRPTIWALAATATIYIGCATYDVYGAVRDAKRRGLKIGRDTSLDDVENATFHGHRSFRSRESSWSSSSSSNWQFPGHFGAMLAGYSGAEKMLITAFTLSSSLCGASHLAPGDIMRYFYHIPATSPNYTLLTSVFGHQSIMHLSLNMYVMVRFGAEVAASPIFQGNGGHFTAFFLSSGILSSLGNHLATLLPTRRYKFTRFARNLGASGVVMALIGAFGMANPQERMGIMFLPGSYPVQNMLLGLALFETYGLFIGIPYVNIGHGAHLAGLAIGCAYVHFDGKKHVWQPTRRLAFNGMKLLSMI
ncbi:hypothetical protein AAE478_006730 [Parahypoxylon ruwenzoriense]